MFPAKRRLSQTRAIITGASSGIGQALAVQLAEKKARLLLTARRTDRLEELAKQVQSRGGDAAVVDGDICKPEVRAQLLETASSQFGGLDILVNNAGIGGIGAFASANESRLREIMEVNFFSVANLIRASLPLLAASNDGLIVNIGSVLGHCAVPKKSEYCASKFALHGLNDALRVELVDDHIDVLLVSPSTTASDFFDNAIGSDGNDASGRRTMSPQHVAQHIVRAIEYRRREVILSAGGKTLVWADRIFPGMVSSLLHRFG